MRLLLHHRYVSALPMEGAMYDALVGRPNFHEGGTAGLRRMISRFHEKALECLDSLFGYALALTRNRAEAEDLVQDSYLRATEASARLAPDSELKTWLFTILRNRFLNQVRQRRNGPQWIDLPEEEGAPVSIPDTHQPDPLAQHLRQVERETVRDAIASLADRDREIILLREFEDLSYAAIAQILGCPVGTVMSRLGRARNRLREVLEREMDAPSRIASSRGASA